MNNEWQEKLESLGAKVDAANNVSFPAAGESSEQMLLAPQQFASPTLVALSHLSVVDITGADADKFFQAQVCNDLNALSDGQAQINGYCSPKGRLLSLFSVYRNNGGYRLIVPADVVPAFVKRLQMYVMRDQVTIEASVDLHCSGLVLTGDNLNNIESLGVLPSSPVDVMDVSNRDDAQMIRWHDDPVDAAGANPLFRYIVVAKADTLFALWQDEQLSRAGNAYWQWGDINAGMPNVFAASVDQFIPQMLNMQLINALSFKKGCYPGQEIVARMQYLGKLKKHMKHLRAPGVTIAPSPGDVLTADTNNNAGQVVDAIVDDSGLNLLAVVNINVPVNEIEVQGVALTEASLPYELTTATNDVC